MEGGCCLENVVEYVDVRDGVVVVGEEGEDDEGNDGEFECAVDFFCFDGACCFSE